MRDNQARDYAAELMGCGTSPGDILRCAQCRSTPVIARGCICDACAEKMDQEESRSATLRISPSRVPIYIECGQAARPVVAIGESTEAGSMGSAAHAALADIVRNGETQPIFRWAEEYQVDETELGWLVAYGRICWDEVRLAFPAPLVERKLEASIADDILLQGTADVLSMVPRGVATLDWKTKREKVPSDFHQLQAYALLGCEALGVEEATVSIAWLRHQDLETRHLTRQDLEDFRGRLLRSLRSETYNLGDHCKYCPRRYECPARQTKLTAATGQLTSQSETLREVIGAGRLPELMETVKEVEKAAKAIRAGVKSHIEESGPIPIDGSDREYYLQQIARRGVNVTAGWDSILEHLGSLGAYNALKLDFKKADKIIGDRTDGPKGVARKAFWDDLRESGAVTETYSDKLATREVESES